MPLDTMMKSNLGRYDKEKADFEASTARAGQMLGDLPQPTGPTAASVNQAAAQKQPSTWAEFTGRGGLQNTAQSTANKIKAKLEGKKMMSQYTNLLAEGEAGADALYRDASVAIGEEVNRYVPQRGMREWGSDKEKVSFYDEKGVFLPHKYAQAVALGVLKWQADQKQKADRMQAGTIIGNSMTPQAANAEMLRSNIDPVPYEKPIGTIETAEELAKKQSDIASTQAGTLSTEQDIEKKRLENQWYPQNQAAINSERNANATNKRGSGGSADRTQLTGLNANLLNFMKERDKLKNENSDPILGGDPKVVIDRNRSIKQYQDVIKSTVDQINERRSALGYPPMVFDEGAPDDIVIAANDILSGMEKLPPKKMESAISKTGNKAYSKKGSFLWWNWTGEPDEVAYANELSDRVIGYVNSKGVNDPRITQQLITEMLKKDNLEDVINDILVSTKSVSAAPAPQQQEQPPAAGTLQSVRY